MIVIIVILYIYIVLILGNTFKQYIVIGYCTFPSNSLTAVRGILFISFSLDTRT